MLDEICAEIKNYFCYYADRHIDDWTISDGVITPSITIPTDYIRIVGSRKNDGVYKVSSMQLQDETFHGAIWIMSPPKDFLTLVSEIESWQAVNGTADSVAMSPFNSETLGAYSYSKSGIARGNNQSATPNVTWKDVYATRLNRFRRVRI